MKVSRFSIMLSALVFVAGLSTFSSRALADDPTGTPTPTPSVSVTPTTAPDTSEQQKDLQSKIQEYQSKISDLESQAKTLNSQIKLVDSQITLSELRVNETKSEIASLEKDIGVAKDQITDLEKDIETVTKNMINRATSIYAIGTINPLHVLLASNGISNFLTKLQYLQVVQLYDKRQVYAAEQKKTNYQEEKVLFEDKQKQAEALKAKLDEYNDQMEAEKKQKQTLLSQTQGSEDNYQKLLSQAKAQLAGFSHFAASQGGASLLSGQTSCDDWGCYYNQRDSQWGGNALNGTQYSIASDGCLVTSMAMMYTHYGHRGVTPSSINSISSNFASYYPAFLLKHISADGSSSDRVGSDIDATLGSGNPVIVGISYDGGPLADHFVVFVSGSGGNYTMKDPFTPNGNNIQFRDRYPSARIVEVEKVAF